MSATSALTQLQEHTFEIQKDHPTAFTANTQGQKKSTSSISQARISSDDLVLALTQLRTPTPGLGGLVLLVETFPPSPPQSVE